MTNERSGPHNPGVKWEGPDFDAAKNEVAMESLEVEPTNPESIKIEIGAAGLKTDTEVTDYREGGSNVVESVNVKYAMENAAPDASSMAIEKIEIALKSDEGVLRGRMEYPNANAREAAGVPDSDLPGSQTGIKADAVDMPVAADAMTSLKAGASEVLMESIADGTGPDSPRTDSLTAKMQNLLNVKGSLGPSHLLEPTGPDGAFMDYTDDGVVGSPDADDGPGDGSNQRHGIIHQKDDVTATFASSDTKGHPHALAHGVNDQTPADWNEPDAADAPDLGDIL